MKAIGADRAFDLTEGNLFYEFDKAKPIPKGRELLVNIKAISVNPIDTKQRGRALEHPPRILGYDAVGIVEATGPDCELFSTGDEVFYSGSLLFDGSNAKYQTMDERYVAKKPKNISFTDAASFPLTAITAYEVLFEIFNISSNPDNNRGKTLLIINGAGGVGSITTQIAKAYGLKVITTAGRDETKQWSTKMGADLVIDYKADLKAQLDAHQVKDIDFIFCTFNTDMYYETMIDLVKPRGVLATIVTLNDKQDLNLLKGKSLTFGHENMFARSINHYDEIQYHRYLTDVTKKVEAGIYQSTTTKVFDKLTPDTLFEAHQLLEKHQVNGKLVINMEQE